MTYMEALNAFLAHPFVLMWLGQFLHLAKELKDREIAGKPQTVRQFANAHPAAIIFSIIAGLVCYSLANTMGQLNPLSAFCIGYVADSVVNIFTQRGLAQLQAPPTKEGETK